MSGENTTPDRDLLEAVLCGDVASDAPEVRAACAASPAFARELTELRELQDLMETDARQEREILAPPASAAPRPRPLRRVLTWVAAAAALFLVLRLAGVGGEPAPREEDRAPIPLGPGEVIRALAPVGAGSGFDVFQVEVRLERAERCRVRIWSGDAGPLDPHLHEAVFEGDAWSPPEAVLAKLPEEILWSATLIAADGTERGSTPAISASR